MLRKFMQSLRVNRPFATLATASGLSSLGSSVVVFALPVVYLNMTDSLASMTAIATAEALVGMIVMFVSGPIVDRFDRLRIMRISQLEETLNDLLLFLLVVFNITAVPVWMALAIVSATFSTVSMNAEGAFIRSIVSTNRMYRAMTVMQGLRYATVLLGPAIGGVILQFSVASVPFLLGVMGEGSAFLLLCLALKPSDARYRDDEDENANDDSDSDDDSDNILRESWKGFSLIIVDGTYRATALFLLLVSLGSGVIFPSLTYGMTLAHAPAVIIASLSMATGLGGLSGAMLINPLVERLHLPLGRSIMLVTLVLAAAVFVAGLVNQWQGYVAMLLLMAMLSPVLVTGLQSFLSAMTPENMQGRIFGALNVSISLASVVTPAMASGLLTGTGVIGAMMTSAAFILLALVSLASSRLLRRIPAADHWDEYLAQLHTNEE